MVCSLVRSKPTNVTTEIKNSLTHITCISPFTYVVSEERISEATCIRCAVIAASLVRLLLGASGGFGIDCGTFGSSSSEEDSESLLGFGGGLEGGPKPSFVSAGAHGGCREGGVSDGDCFSFFRR